MGVDSWHVWPYRSLLVRQRRRGVAVLGMINLFNTRLDTKLIFLRFYSSALCPACMFYGM